MAGREVDAETAPPVGANSCQRCGRSSGARREDSGLTVYALRIEAWFESLWDTLTSVSIGALVGAMILQTLQTTMVGVAYTGILRAAYPAAMIRWLPIIACYAASVAMNSVLPANIGTFALLFMFLMIIPGATFPGVFSGYLVQKIFYTVVGTAIYLYLFLSVPGSFDVSLSGLDAHKWLALAIAAGVIFGLVVLAGIFWRKVKHLWEQAKQGAAILATPSRYVTRVLAPQLVGYLAKLGVIAIFLATYGIPVTAHSIFSVIGSSSIANTVAVTPGGAGVNQAANVVALQSVTDSATATAYSVGQQVFTTAWNIVFAVIMISWAFGWKGGRQMVKASYIQAKARAAEEKAKRREKKSERRADEGSAAQAPKRRRPRRRKPRRDPRGRHRRDERAPCSLRGQPRRAGCARHVPEPGARWAGGDGADVPRRAPG